MPVGLFSLAMNTTTHFEASRDGFIVSTDPGRLDLNVIHSYLSERSYWAKGIPREIVERSLNHSLCFGVYDDARQVGLARVITDRTTYAYLCDVFILETHRGQGLGKWLVSCVLGHPELQGLRRFTLATLDAHGLYRPFGFKEADEPEKLMEIGRPNAYSTKPDDGQAMTART
jgi:GNAT superfamily N-acetyltransferase